MIGGSQYVRLSSVRSHSWAGQLSLVADLLEEDTWYAHDSVTGHICIYELHTSKQLTSLGISSWRIAIP